MFIFFYFFADTDYKIVNVRRRKRQQRSLDKIISFNISDTKGEKNLHNNPIKF